MQHKPKAGKGTQVDIKPNVVLSTEEGTKVSFADARIPDFKKSASVSHIPFGTGDDYPDYLQMLYDKSAKHAAIINTKVVYILGNGFDKKDENVNAFLAAANPKQSWDELSKPICHDIENKGGLYLQVIPKKGKNGYNVYHVSYDKMRTNKDNTFFWYKEDDEKKWQTANLKKFPAFYNGIKEPSIFYYKEFRSKRLPYALPSWVAACNWIESDIEVSKATLTNAKTGFSASKFINFFNGEPDETKKKSIQKRFENAATGAEGKKILIGFNNDPEKAPTVDDLGQSDLTKEDFTAVNDLITDNVYAGHCVTHPLLFGIQQEGKLGNSQELKLAFDIFKNTYANAKQRNIENIVKRFASYAGVTGEIKLVDIEPVGLELTEATLLKVAPLDWLREKLNIDKDKYPGPPADNSGAAAAPATPPAATEPIKQSADSPVPNEVLMNLSGKQQYQLMRTVRLFSKGKLTIEQAMLQMAGFGFTEEQARTYLGVKDEEFVDETEEYTEEAAALLFEAIGEDKEVYTLIEYKGYTNDEDAFAFAFDAAVKLSDLQKDIVAILKKDPKASDEIIATTLQKGVDKVAAAIDDLIKNKIVAPLADKTGRKVLKTEGVKSIPTVMVRYSYEKRAIAEGPEVLPTTRPFCKKLCELNKYYTREEIQMISERLGYSVFKRAGGFWKRPDGVTDYQCRHEWRANVVIKK